VKRSTTKQKIRHAENRLALKVAECLARWDEADEDWREGTLANLGLWLTHLLSFHVQLDDSWPRDRWLDGIEDLSISIEGASVLRLKGTLWWGLLSNVGGAQTAALFEGAICLTGLKRRPVAYELRLGENRERRYFARGDVVKLEHFA
jgi:hypothetical protein